MIETNKTLDSILETEFIPANEVDQTKETLPMVPTGSVSVEEDFDYSRRNYHDLLEKGGLALDGILEVAKESQHPRAYEVAATLMKNLADMTDKLLLLQKQKKDLTGEAPAAPKQTVNVDKAVFVGSAADLLKQIKNGNN